MNLEQLLSLQEGWQKRQDSTRDKCDSVTVDKEAGFSSFLKAVAPHF